MENFSEHLRSPNMIVISQPHGCNVHYFSIEAIFCPLRHDCTSKLRQELHHLLIYLFTCYDHAAHGQQRSVAS